MEANMNNQFCHSPVKRNLNKRTQKKNNSVKIDACELQSAMDTELFTMPTGLGIEGMRKFIKECARK